MWYKSQALSIEVRTLTFTTCVTFNIVVNIVVNNDTHTHFTLASYPLQFGFTPTSRWVHTTPAWVHALNWVVLEYLMT